MSSSPYHRIESPRAQQGESSSSRAPRSPHTGPTLPPMRYPGDGLDFRRPAMSSREPDPVIDLTNEPDSSPQQPPLRRSSSGPASRNARQPRFGRDILAEPDVVNLVDEPDSPGDRDPPRSPEVEFVRATTRPHRMHGFGQSMLRLMRRVATQDNYNEDLVWQNRYLRARSRPVDMETFFIGEGAGHGIDVELNFGGLSPAPPQSSYKPPSPPPKGFTRSAGEKDVVVCPNCDMELGTGDEEKQQIWVVKQCGHVSSAVFCLFAFTDSA